MANELGGEINKNLAEWRKKLASGSASQSSGITPPSAKAAAISESKGPGLLSIMKEKLTNPELGSADMKLNKLRK